MSDDDQDYDIDGPAPRTAAAAAAAAEHDPEQLLSPVVNWRELDPADAGPIWKELDEWVRWARHRYDLRMLQPCWFKHPVAVEQLSALHTAWTVLYADEDSGLGPITFLEKTHGIQDVLRSAMQGCSKKEHRFIALPDWPDAAADEVWRALTSS